MKRLCPATGENMKYIIIALFGASVLTVTLVATAENSGVEDTIGYEGGVERVLSLKPRYFTGLVLETAGGIAITTNMGIFLLKGVGVKNMVGKKVHVRGILRDGYLLALNMEIAM
jgi:hypothetical protein